MSRLDAIAQELRVSREQAKAFTRAVRERFDAAPGYAQILRAIRDCRKTQPGHGRPSPSQVATALTDVVDNQRTGLSARRGRRRRE